MENLSVPLGKRSQSIWILEDDPGAVFVYNDILEIRYHLTIFNKLDDLHKAIERGEPSPDLLIADLRLNGESFLEFVETSSYPIYFPFLVVSSVDEVDVLRSCFSIGALDYLTKPFKKSELLVKIERALNRVWLPTNNNEKFQLDPSQLSVTTFKGKQRLTAKEFQILHLLSTASDQTKPKKEILEKVWEGYTIDPKALSVHLHSLRKKLLTIGMDVVHQPPDNYRLNVG